MTYEVLITGKDGRSQSFQVEIARERQSEKLICRLDGKEVEIDVRSNERDVLSLLLGSRSYEARLDASEQRRIMIGEESFAYEVRDPRSLGARRAKAISSDGPKKIKAPMPGKVVRIIAPAGSSVEAGEGVIVIEAMKMQNELKSPKSGKVKRIMAAEGATVSAGDALAEIE